MLDWNAIGEFNAHYKARKFISHVIQMLDWNATGEVNSMHNYL